MMNIDDESIYEDSGNETSGDDVDYAIDVDGAANRELQTCDDDYHYEVLSTSDIMQHMVDCIMEVNNVVQLPPTVTRILLNYFHWDKEKLMERFFDENQSELFKEAHVVNPFAAKTTTTSKGRGAAKSSRKSSIAAAAASSSADECDICFRVVGAAQMAGLECGHRFCLQCWNEYLKTKIMEEGVGQTIACAAHNCPILVDDDSVMRLVVDARVKLKYQCLITNNFIECNKLLRWCPSPDCNYAVKVNYVDFKPVTCRCQHTFCFACGENWHDPVKCNVLKKWLKKLDDDSETSNWISANTKECPRCNATIEKDGGCNHMICKNQSCKADFCWVCLGPWDPHGSSWYNCNKYDEDEAKAARDAQEKSRAALQRYLFYCNRYMNHQNSLQYESKLYDSVKDKMEQMQQHNMSWIEVQFLKMAVDILCKCRQTLMYTYVFAFYLTNNNQSVIFEDNQKDLEQATEKLSEYLERDITNHNLVNIKQQVQDKYRYCEVRRIALLNHVHEGYDKDWWACIE